MNSEYCLEMLSKQLYTTMSPYYIDITAWSRGQSVLGFVVFCGLFDVYISVVECELCE